MVAQQIEIQLSSVAHIVRRQRGRLAVKRQALLGQACDGSKAGRLTFHLKDRGQ